MKPVIILVTPQLGENIGATARAMLNFGLDGLRIVNPRDGWPNQKALDMAKGAAIVIEKAMLYTTLADALADIQWAIAATARNRDMHKPIYHPATCTDTLITHSRAGHRTALVFGAERSGLTNEDITLMDAILHIPVSQEYPSLNLAQAVAVMCFCWFSTLSSSSSAANPTSLPSTSTPAPKKDILAFFEHLEKELEKSGFFSSAHIRPTMAHNIRNLFQRLAMTEQEVRTLRGIVRSLAKGRG